MDFWKEEEAPLSLGLGQEVMGLKCSKKDLN